MHIPCAQEVLDVLNSLENTHIPLYDKLAGKSQILAKQAIEDTIKEIRGQIVLKVPIRLRNRLKK